MEILPQLVPLTTVKPQPVSYLYSLMPFSNILRGLLCLPRKPHYVSNEFYHTFLVYVWCHYSWHLHKFWVRWGWKDDAILFLEGDHEQYIYLFTYSYLFTFSLAMSWYLAWVSYRQHMLGSFLKNWFFQFQLLIGYFIYLDNWLLSSYWYLRLTYAICFCYFLCFSFICFSLSPLCELLEHFFRILSSLIAVSWIYHFA